MKRDFRLNDRASSQDSSGRLFYLIYGPFSQSGGKLDGRVGKKGIAFLQGNFDNVSFSENYWFTVHKGDAESLTDLIDRYLSLNST